MMRSLHLHAAKCTDARQYAMACSDENYGVFNRWKSRITVFDLHEAAAGCLHLHALRRGVSGGHDHRQ